MRSSGLRTRPGEARLLRSPSHHTRGPGKEIRDQSEGARELRELLAWAEAKSEEEL